MSTSNHPFGVTPTKVGSAKPASLCCVYIEKIVATPQGDKVFGGGTGFHYRDALGRVWLITNWHVLTARRPDNPGMLLPGYPQSPYRLSVKYPGPKVGQFFPAVTLDLYDEQGKPIWRQLKLDLGNDLAGIPIELPKGVISPCIQDFSERDSATLQPGFDVVVIGFPFEQNQEMPFPVWKRAMVASEPAYTVFGQVQALLDTPGTPGMSGSPVYRITPAVAFKKNKAGQFGAAEPGGDFLKAFEGLDLDTAEPTVGLNWVGIYAGTTGQQTLERLSLGRMMHASMVDLMTLHGEDGVNPFPPVDIS